MLSILIPVYNRPVCSLVHTLASQCRALGIAFEIQVQEDGSATYLTENAALAGLPNVFYTQYAQNAGRASIRNRLADEARYNQLIFLDCDSEVLQNEFIGEYIKYTEYDLVYGGTIYLKPQKGDLMLHYLYGSSREAIPASQRAKNPYASFRTNNFMVKKDVFARVRFDESLKQYGHEDTLFALTFAKVGFNMKHIENPVLHGGLEETTEFLKKSKMALENGWQLVQSGDMEPSAIKVIDGYLKLMSVPSGAWFLNRLYRYEAALIRNLSSDSPHLRRFDLLRLIWLHQIDLKSRN